MPKFTIPEEHYPKFETFLALTDGQRGDIIEQLAKLPIGATPGLIFDEISKNVSGINETTIDDIITIYISLVNARERSEEDWPVFLNYLKTAIEDAKITHPKSIDETVTDFENLLKSSKNISITAKVASLGNQNQRIFKDCEIFQDIRTALDKNGDLVGSMIIYNVKFDVIEGLEDEKEIFISLDEADINNLNIKIQQALASAARLREHFSNANFIDLKK